MRTIRKFIASCIIVASAICVQSTAYAGSCGEGVKILSVLEGGWNTDDLMIEIDSFQGSDHAGTYWANKYVQYRASTLSPQRLNAIRAVALSALLSGKRVRPYTVTDRCDNASELAIFAN